MPANSDSSIISLRRVIRDPETGEEDPDEMMEKIQKAAMGGDEDARVLFA